MGSSVSGDEVTDARALQRSLGSLESDIAAKVVAAAADIALVVDGNGVIQDLAVATSDLKREDYRGWLGQRWVETVQIDSRTKVEELLRDAGSDAGVKGREVNQASPEGASIPIRFSAVQVGGDGRVLALGRDLRVVSRLQQRLVDLQRSMEREYARLRHAETRYRVLFQLSSEAILIVDAASLRIVDANPSTLHLLGVQNARLNGKTFADLFDPGVQDEVEQHLAAARATGRATPVSARLGRSGAVVQVSAALFRQETTSHFLVRLTIEGAVSNATASGSRVSEIMERLPEGFVVTDPAGNVLEANSAFLDMAQLASS
jgi:transcriptional regulator PpsR